LFLLYILVNFYYYSSCKSIFKRVRNQIY